MKKILHLDTETSPTLGYTYQKYDSTMIDVREESFMLSFAYKWEHKKAIKALSLADFPSFKRDRHDDTELLKALWRLLDEADVVVAHNGDAFDVKQTQGYFIRKGMRPPSPFRTVDTLKVARRAFRLFSNKLTDVAKVLGIGEKVHVEHSVWRRCMDGDRRAFAELKRYNAHDVRLLSEVYHRMLPWVPNHPHVDPEMGEGCCPNCGGMRAQRRGVDRQVGGVKARYQCQDCGKWWRGRMVRD